MCTVSFIPAKDRVFITSNRDEKARRKPACLPEYFFMQNCGMAFPKDGEAGGTWINLCNTGNAGVLLNGAFDRHKRKPGYTKSRGLVFLEFMDSERPLRKFLKSSLKGIEPFTFILWQNNNLYECRWDEFEYKHCKPLPSYRPYIWSSATLYDNEVRKKRELWFAKWLNTNCNPTMNDILEFHHFGGDGDQQNDLFMNRDGKVFTVSITGLELRQDRGIMSYTDVVASKTSEQIVEFSNQMIISR